MVGTATIARMGGKKSEDGKKPSGGKNTTPRTPVQMPVDWLKVARLRAATNRQPILWYLIGLIEADAKSYGMADLPPFPWDSEEPKVDRG